MAVIVFLCLVAVVLGVALSVHGNGRSGVYTSRDIMVLIVSLLLLILLSIYLNVEVSTTLTSNGSLKG